MRYSTLLISLLFPLSAFAESAPEPPTEALPAKTSADTPPTDEAAPPAPTVDPPPTEQAPPAPEDTTTTPPVSTLISDQDFLLLPEDPSTPATDLENTLTGEITAEDMFTEPMEFEGSPLPVADPRTLAASTEADERRLKIRYKNARLKAEKDAALVSLLEKARTARTFEAERAAYRAYYRELFRAMRKLDSSIAKQCDLMEKTYLTQLAQTRVEPTIPLEPPPKIELLSN